MHLGSPTLAGWQACSSADDDEGQPYLWVMDYLEIGVCFCAEGCSGSQSPGIAGLRDFGLPLPGLSPNPKPRNPNSNSFCSPFWARGCESQSEFGCRDVLERGKGPKREPCQKRQSEVYRVYRVYRKPPP